MRDAGEETVAVSGDPVLIEVLAAAQRFAAWYAEFLARDSGVSGQIDVANGELVTSKLQHAVFDLMAAVHAMNRHCADTERRRTVTSGMVRVRVPDDALH